MRRFRTLGLGGLAASILSTVTFLGAFGCSDEDQSSRKAPDLPGAAACTQAADVVLKPGPRGATRTHSFASNLQPSITLQIAESETPVQSKVILSSCDGEARKELVFDGSGSFSVLERAAWPSELESASCLDVAVTTGTEGNVESAAYASVHRGDFRITGVVALPKGSNESPASAEVLVDVGNTTRAAQVNADGSFEIPNVAPGLIKTVRAALKQGHTLLIGQSHPLFLLDAAHTTASVSVTLLPAISPRDEFEPDDEISLLANRPSLALRTPQEHVLATKSDADLIPFDATSGHSYRVAVSPVGNPADLAVAILDSSGSVLAEVNALPGDFTASPAAVCKATSTGRLYARVSRNDDVASLARFSIEIDVIAIK